MNTAADFIAAVEATTGRAGRRNGRNVRLLCPAHDDHHPSLDVAEGFEGQPLVQCRSNGCSFEAICHAIGREPHDYRQAEHRESAQAEAPPGNPATPQQPLAGCTLHDYAASKGFEEDFLQTLGLTTEKYNGHAAVRIPYRTSDGLESATRFRVALSKGPGEGDCRFFWKKGSRPSLYGLERLAVVRSTGFVILVEGESDCHRLWAEDYPALGLPGAGTWRDDRDARHLAVAEGEEPLVIFVVIEPDAGGESVLRSFSRSQLRDQVRLVSLPFKDVCDLYADEPGRFRERLDAALAYATPFDVADDARRQQHRADAWAACAQLAREPNILDRVVEALRQCGLVGEERNARLLYLTLTSRLLRRPVSVAVKGQSSAGKSFVVAKTLELFPPEASYSLTAMSERALAYSDEPLEHRTLVIYEAAGMEGDFASYLIRSLLSEGQVRYETVEKTADGLRPRLIERQGPTGLITTTTKIALHPENENRLLSILVTDSREQTAAILRAIAEEKQERVVDPLQWYALQRWIANGPCEVAIPYADELAACIPPVAVRLRRDFFVLLTLIKAHALLHQATRARNADGDIEASLQDYGVVRELVTDVFGHGVGASVPAALRETVMAIPQHPSEGPSIRVLAERLGVDKSTASRRVREAIDRGYIVNLAQGQPGKPFVLTRGEPLPHDVELLPRLEALECCTVARGQGEYPRLPSIGQPGYLALNRCRYRADHLTHAEYRDRIDLHGLIYPTSPHSLGPVSDRELDVLQAEIPGLFEIEP